MSEKKIRVSQAQLLMEYYKAHSNQEVPHPKIVDWATKEWLNRTGTVFRDPDRGIRQLHQEGYLIKISKGVYKYDPEAVRERVLEDFTLAQKKEIMKRDEYKCVVCGRGKTDGVDLQVDHIKPRDLGGKAEISNGQTLCAQHNFQKKNYKQTESGKKFFIRLYDLAKQNNDTKLQNFCAQVLEVYEKNEVNGHIEWKK